MVAEVLLDNPHVHIECDLGECIVTMVRTETELPRERDGLVAFYREVVAALDPLPRAELIFIVDGRAAVGRNDEVFEQAQATYAPLMFGGFQEVIGVVKTTVGRMQVARYDNDRKTSTPVFGSVEEARAFVLQRRRTASVG